MTDQKDKAVSPDDLPFQTIEGPNSTWVEITTVGSEEEASLLKGFLENERIPSQIESLRVDELPVNFGKLGEIRVYVPAENEAAALSLLEQRQREYERLPADGTIVTDEGQAEVTEDVQTVVEEEE